MYAVHNESAVFYYGDDREAAMKVLEANPCANMTAKANAEWLAQKFNPSVETQSAEEDALDSVLNTLEELGLNAQDNAEKFVETLQQQSERAVAEVRSLGIKSMNAIGDSFVALGDLLKRAVAEDEQKK